MIIEELIHDRKRFNIKNCMYDPPVAFRIHNEWQLYKPSIYKWTWDLGVCGIAIPCGYRWDGASVPRMARSIVDSTKLFDASIIHDMGYDTQGGDKPYRIWQQDGTFIEEHLVDWCTNRQFSEPIARGRWDALLFAFALESGVPPGMAEETYVAVFIGGQDAWNSLQ